MRIVTRARIPAGNRNQHHGATTILEAACGRVHFLPRAGGLRSGQNSCILNNGHPVRCRMSRRFAISSGSRLRPAASADDGRKVLIRRAPSVKQVDFAQPSPAPARRRGKAAAKPPARKLQTDTTVTAQQVGSWTSIASKPLTMETPPPSPREFTLLAQYSGFQSALSSLLPRRYLH